MLVPISWLEKYIKLEHSEDELGDILTKMDTMQDGPIKDINGYHVIDIEVRQNRSDLLSIIGVAREYAAFINKPVNYPEEIDSKLLVEWGKPEINLDVKEKELVRRFTTVEINNLHIKESPKWMQAELNCYGIPAINNIVDITNYVMLEYGIPLHAFDKSKLSIDDKNAILTLRRASNDEKFETWQKTKINLTTEDIVVADAKKTVAIAGIIGGLNSGIDKKTTSIILEAATYNHASIRRSALRHNIQTDASSRHCKFMNPAMIEKAINRALYLIKELAGGDVIRIEDYYNKDDEESFNNRTLDFDMNQILRLAGIQLETPVVAKCLERLGFQILEQKEAIGIDKNILIIRIPDWRTDISYEEDIVEEILRLLGYENIPFQEIDSAPPEYATPKVLQLEDKIKDLLVALGYDEQITSPLCKFDKSNTSPRQIKLENSLTSELDGLRVSIWQSLIPVLDNNIKAGVNTPKIFESGKIYWEVKIGEYKEERRIVALTANIKLEKVKGDLFNIINKLGIQDIKEELVDKNSLIISINNKTLAELKANGFELYIENIQNIVNIGLIPYIKIETALKQRIAEEISFSDIKEHLKLGDIKDAVMKKYNEYVEDVIYIMNEKEGVENLKIILSNEENNLTRTQINEIMKDIKTFIEKKFSVKIR